MTTGHDMRALIERAGISQLEAARRLGIDGSTLRRYLARRDGKVPRIAWLAICAVCGLEPLRAAARDLVMCSQQGEEQTGLAFDACLERLREVGQATDAVDEPAP